MPSTGSEVFVHARFVDGTTAVVGRYRFRRDRSDSNIGEFRYAGSWLRNAHGRAFALDPVNLPLSRTRSSSAMVEPITIASSTT
jgi:serine/threonine-protein kinase HipA